jgi:hypothetical protein
MKKGYIILYALLIGSLILLITLIMLKFEFESNRNLQYKRQRLEINDHLSYKREKIFGNLFDILVEKAVVGSKTDIIQCMENNNSWFNIAYEDLSMSFNVERGLIMLVCPYNSYKDLVEYYDIYPYRSGIKLNLVHSEYK